MRQQALQARLRQRGLPSDKGERASGAVPAKTLDRQFQAAAPSQKWVADWTAESWLDGTHPRKAAYRASAGSVLDLTGVF
jgi:hypothetical protein